MKKQCLQPLFFYFSWIVLLTAFAACNDDNSITEGEGNMETHIPNLPGEVMTRAALVRTFGLGYGYDGVNGRACDFSSLRNQVIDNGLPPWVYQEDNKVNKPYIEDVFALNVSDYLEGLSWGIDISGNMMGAIKGEIDYKYSYFKSTSDGYYMATSRRIHPVANRYYTDDALGTLFDGDSFLTDGFENALTILANYRYAPYLIDDFFEIYGTHVVVYATMGGKLEMDIRLKQSCANSLKESTLGWSVALLFMFNKASKEQLSEYFTLTKNSYSARLDVHGGDVEILNPYLDRSNLSLEKQTAPDLLDKWAESIHYDSKNLKNNTAEIVDLKLLPIWRLVEDTRLRDALEKRYNVLLAERKETKIDNKGNIILDDLVCIPLNKSHGDIGPNDVSIYYLEGKPLFSCIPNVAVQINSNNVTGKAYFPLQNGIEQFDKGLFLGNDNKTCADIKIPVNEDGTLGNAIAATGGYSQEGIYTIDALQMCYGYIAPIVKEVWDSGKLKAVDAIVTQLPACEYSGRVANTIGCMEGADNNLYTHCKPPFSFTNWNGWMKGDSWNVAKRNNLTFRYVTPPNLSWKNFNINHYPQ